MNDALRGNVADALSNAISEGFGLSEDERDLETKRMLADSSYILRGFGVFDVGVGAGVAGGTLSATPRRSRNNDKEALRDAHIKCPIGNRICASIATSRLGSRKMTIDDEQMALLIDFGSAPSAAQEDWDLNDGKLGPTDISPKYSTFPHQGLRRSD